MLVGSLLLLRSGRLGLVMRMLHRPNHLRLVERWRQRCFIVARVARCEGLEALMALPEILLVLRYLFLFVDLHVLFLPLSCWGLDFLFEKRSQQVKRGVLNL